MERSANNLTPHEVKRGPTQVVSDSQISIAQQIDGKKFFRDANNIDFKFFVYTGRKILRLCQKTQDKYPYIYTISLFFFQEQHDAYDAVVVSKIFFIVSNVYVDMHVKRSQY